MPAAGHLSGAIDGGNLAEVDKIESSSFRNLLRFEDSLGGDKWHGGTVNDREICKDFPVKYFYKYPSI